jgi:hypothetical protein
LATRPASATSLSAADSAARRSAVSVTVTEATSARIDCLASDLARRMAVRTSEAAPRTATSPAPASSRIDVPSGQPPRWIEPSCHHDQTSSVTNGRNGANSRSSTFSARSSAARADSAPAPSP